MQLSLRVQLPHYEGGLSGSCCYVTTLGALPTKRLEQLSATYPGSLDGIHTVAASSPGALLHILATAVPSLLQTLSPVKPLRLLVVDSLAALFREEKTSSATLRDRARDISDIAAHLHQIAIEHCVVVIVVNDVADVFGLEADTHDVDIDGEPIYRDQARYFGTASNIPG